MAPSAATPAVLSALLAGAAATWLFPQGAGLLGLNTGHARQNAFSSFSGNSHVGQGHWNNVAGHGSFSGNSHVGKGHWNNVAGHGSFSGNSHVGKGHWNNVAGHGKTLRGYHNGVWNPNVGRKTTAVIYMTGGPHTSNIQPQKQHGNPATSPRLEPDDWFDAQFTGHPKFACAKTNYPGGKRYESYRYKFRLATPGMSTGLYCVFQGSKQEFSGMVRSVGIYDSVRAFAGGCGLFLVSAPGVRCVTQPRLLASLFDLLVVSGRPPYSKAWCLLARAQPKQHTAHAPRFAEPTGGGLAIRFRGDHLQDVTCSPYKIPDKETSADAEDVDFFLEGVLERRSELFQCNFHRSVNATGTSIDTLVNNMVLGLHLDPGSSYRGRHVISLPVHTCREACPDRAPRPDDLLLQMGSYHDDYGLDFTVTSPAGRTATCSAPDDDIYDHRTHSVRVDVVFSGHPPLVCQSNGVPLGKDVDGTDFYFIVSLDQDFHGANTFRCKIRNGECIGGDAVVESTLEGMANAFGLTVTRVHEELGRKVPSVYVTGIVCGTTRLDGFLHYFQVSGDFRPPKLQCALGSNGGEPQQPNQERPNSPEPNPPNVNKGHSPKDRNTEVPLFIPDGTE